MRLHIRNRLHEVFDALDHAEDALDKAALNPSFRADIRLVLEELMVNTVRHGYPDGRDGSIAIKLDIRPPTVTVELRDDAMPFNPLGIETPELPGDLAQHDAVGGLGVHLARSIASDMHYSRDGDSNHVVIRFDQSLSEETPA
ncbi:serine/threonine-protein kinase RsbW [Luteibacter rhizovicinus]|uniref:Serine/threonine-protein kinase RsbW n=1 Tax=Luteibacter rhizovicinus TaxID=242606 RepID=A0A4R3YIG3_9GAMM|nr:ATP-binding protein [Luteibacter rhizovicinus]TCV91832.1 serine/threonine-protein kinase RsbW [Luteibacter rhizovicinus]